MRGSVLALCVAIFAVTAASPANSRSGENSAAGASSATAGPQLDTYAWAKNEGEYHVSGVDWKAYCREQMEAETNNRATQGDADTELPYPDAPVIENPAVDACRGYGARVVANPPGEPCPYGHVKAEVVYFNFELALDDWNITNANDWNDARRAGGDSGAWIQQYVCLEIFPDTFDKANFTEIIGDPGLDKSPHVSGLTGLETWVWHDFSQPEAAVMSRTFTAQLGNTPFEMVATVWVDQIRWDFDGDRAWDVVIDPADTENEPASLPDYISVGGTDDADGNAGSFMFLRKGVYPVTIEVEWRGMYEFVEFPANNGFYDPVIVTTTEDYRVCEVVGVLTAGDRTSDLTGCPPA